MPKTKPRFPQCNLCQWYRTKAVKEIGRVKRCECDDIINYRRTIGRYGKVKIDKGACPCFRKRKGDK
jgi:hypothetical protein